MFPESREISRNPAIAQIATLRRHSGVVPFALPPGPYNRRKPWPSPPPGTRLGPYEIVSGLGAGGMGEVYRARDTKLHRDVAIKVLPQSFASDPDRLARFQREAETLASLNHPNIAIIHGLEQTGDVHALVMELVLGEDLSQRIARGACRIDEALPIAKQIAEALEDLPLCSKILHAQKKRRPYYRAN
jgi:serine/threonine protein kinase